MQKLILIICLMFVARQLTLTYDLLYIATMHSQDGFIQTLL
jgi:hypothetical protein